jgi:ligand-binding SRPBCC domain-containing protein
MGFRVISPLPDAAYPGLMIRYRVRPLLGIPVTWVTEITQVRSGEYFVDEQRAGPYRLWHHEHHFRAVPGGVEMRDVVHYALPFGPLGDWLNALLVRRRVAGIFDYRSAVLARMFGTAPAPAPAAAPPPIAAIR